jgi:hypothetical protein
MLRQVLFQGLGGWRLGVAWASALLGWILLGSAIQCGRILEQSLSRQDAFLSPAYLIIHKPVPLLSVLGKTGAGFSEAEIAELRKQPFVDAVEPFVANRFQARATFGDNLLMPELETDLFFESVPDSFLDLRPEGWSWPSDPPCLPIILPRDYLVLYNFGFAPSQNLPQISEVLIRQMRFTVHLAGRGKTADIPGRIVGFSDRLGSILVPRAFMDWANSQWGEGRDQYAKLVIKARNSDGQALQAFLDQKKYQCNTEQLRTARVTAALRFALEGVFFMGVLVAALAFWVISLSLQLLITRNSESLKRLIFLGYHPRQLLARYMGLMGVTILVMHGLALLVLYFSIDASVRLVNRYGFPVGPSSLGPTVVVLSLGAISIAALFWGFLRWAIYRLAAPNKTRKPGLLNSTPGGGHA